LIFNQAERPRPALVVASGAVREEDRRNLLIESDLLRKAPGLGPIGGKARRHKKHEKTKSAKKEKRREPVCACFSYATLVATLLAPKTRNDELEHSVHFKSEM
jgi:hypothetical protein